MRADSAGAKTWLLGAIALWAICSWVLGLFGMGERIDPLAEDQALLQPLPMAGKPLPARLGPLPQYAEIGQRPLFSEDRRPHPFFIDASGEDDGKNDFDFVLTSVLIAPGFQMAILQPSGGGESERVKVGAAPDSAKSWTLVSVGARNAVFNGPEGERKLELRVFDGVGGEPPSVSSADHPPGTPPTMAQPMPRGVVDATPDPMQPTPADNPPASAPSPKPPGAPDAADARQSSDQIDAIRKRIEARRAKLRQDEMSETSPPGKKP